MIMRFMRRAVCGAIDSSGRHVLVALQALRRQFENPTEDQRGKKSDREQNDDAARQPIGRAEHRQHGARHLGEQPRADQIEPGRADDVASLQLGEE